jgi:adenosylcobinamide-phosphate synthase
VAPLLWGFVAGVPGLLAYRMINTLDAMVGYRNERYENFGWASARLDDVANYLPARLTGALVIALGPNRRCAVAAVRRDARAHPSPNAGVVEAAFAGALGVSVGGRTVYRHRIEDRPVLGRGPAPAAVDVRRTARLSRRVQVGALATVAVGQFVAAALIGLRTRTDRTTANL